MKTPVLTLITTHIQHLSDLTSHSTVAVKICRHRRAMALSALHQVKSYLAMGQQLRVRYDAAVQFAECGLAILRDQPRSGRPLASTGSERAALTALGCSPTPGGHSR